MEMRSRRLASALPDPSAEPIPPAELSQNAVAEEAFVWYRMNLGIPRKEVSMLSFCLRVRDTGTRPLHQGYALVEREMISRGVKYVDMHVVHQSSREHIRCPNA